MASTYSQADKDQAVQEFARRRRMHPDESAWAAFQAVGKRRGILPDTIWAWAIKAGAYTLAQKWTDAERRAVAECYANLSQKLPHRNARELAREVGYAFGVSRTTVQKWARWFGLYHRSKCSPLHPWRRRAGGDSRHEANRRGGVPAGA